MRRWRLAAALFGLALLAVTAAHARDLTAVVSILPQAYFLERVGGEGLAVEVLVGPGQSPHTYEPTPKQMASLGSADLYVRIGIPFEEALARKVASLAPNLMVVEGWQGIELQPMAEADHGHPVGDHDHGRLDPHFWLDPLLVKVHAATVCEALCRLDPQRAPEFRANLAALQADLDALHARLQARLAAVAGRTMYVFHPAYGYLAHRYGLEQVAVQVEGKEPSARQTAELVERARAAGVSALFVQPQFSSRAAEVIAEAVGAELVPLDPLARDYIANMDRMAELVAAGCGSPGHGQRD